MTDLSTAALVDAELEATGSYDVDYDVALAKRHAVALRRKLDFSAQSARGDQSRRDDQAMLERRLNQCLAWIRANQATTAAQRLRNPSVTHADFSTFRGYGGGGEVTE